MEKVVSGWELVIDKFPETDFAGKGYREIGQAYEENGDLINARSFYERAEERVPLERRAPLREKIEDLNIRILFSPIATDQSVLYEVQPGDTLGKIARKFKTTVNLIKRSNHLKDDLIIPGRKLKVTISKFSIVVNATENILFLNRDGELFKTYTVSTGEDNSTPAGTFFIEEKMVKPVWYKMGAVVSPESAEYELGSRWLGLSLEGYGIHGTSDESTIGSHVTKGCVRLKNNEVEELFDIVPSGSEVIIIK